MWRESMTGSELFKLFRRKLVWAVMLGIFLLMGVSELYLNSYYLYGGHYGELQDEMALYEKYRGSLTDERLQNFLKERWGAFREKYPEDEYNYMDSFRDANGNEMSMEQVSVESAFPGVSFPIQFGYFEGWALFLDQLPRYVKYIPIFIVVAFSALFTYERECNMQEMLLCAKRGRRDCIRAKVAGAFLVTNVMCIVVMAVPCIIAFFLYRGNGLDTGIQMTPWLRGSQLEMGYGELLLHTVFLSVLAVNVVLLIALIAAYLAKSPMTAMCVTLGVLYLLRPDIVSGYVPIDVVNKFTSLLPVNVVDTMNLAKQGPVTIGGIELQWITVAEILYVALFAGEGCLFLRLQAKRRKYDAV